MKRLGNLWGQVIAFENLYRAYRQAKSGKSHSPEVILFTLNLERELFCLQKSLQSGDYQPGAYRLFTLYERKPRQIAAAPFRDRVIHHAVLNVIEPPIDRQFIGDSYACRKGKGVHAAVARYQHWSKRYSYALKLDIARYFPSIDHSRLKQKLRHKIKDGRVLGLLDKIIDTSPRGEENPVWFPGDDLLTPFERRTGIPIGNLTSQFFANLYLDGLDHFIKETCRVKAYLRYVDDLFLLDDDKGRLRELAHKIQEKLNEDRLLLHPRKTHVLPVRQGLDVLGYRVFPDFRLLRNDNGHRFSRRLKLLRRAYAEERISLEDVSHSVHSWIGHSLHADTFGLRSALLREGVFSRQK